MKLTNEERVRTWFGERGYPFSEKSKFGFLYMTL